MSYDPEDEARDRFYEEVSKELYPEHKSQAIEEFTAERLRSYYLSHPGLMVPAMRALREAEQLRDLGHHAAAVTFAASAVELLLKAALLKPIVYGLVHHEAIAETIVDFATGQTGIDRYQKLLEILFLQLAKVDLGTVKRTGSTVPIFKDCNNLQAIRNSIVHKGEICDEKESAWALTVARDVHMLIVCRMFNALELATAENDVLIQCSPPSDDDIAHLWGKE